MTEMDELRAILFEAERIAGDLLTHHRKDGETIRSLIDFAATLSPAGVTEEQVEAAARVMAARVVSRVATAPGAQSMVERGWVIYADDARAALEAAAKTQPSISTGQGELVAWSGDDIPMECPFPPAGALGAPNAYEIDPGVGSAMDRVQRDWPLEAVIENMRLRGGSIRPLYDHTPPAAAGNVVPAAGRSFVTAEIMGAIIPYLAPAVSISEVREKLDAMLALPPGHVAVPVEPTEAGIRICPRRDGPCPHGMSCTYWQVDMDCSTEPRAALPHNQGEGK